MIVGLLTEHHLGFSQIGERLQGLVWVYTCQNATFFEITCHSSHDFLIPFLSFLALFPPLYCLSISCCFFVVFFPSIRLSFCLSVLLTGCLSVFQLSVSICLSVYLPIHLPVCLCLSVSLSVCPPASRSVRLSICVLSVCLFASMSICRSAHLLPA